MCVLILTLILHNEDNNINYTMYGFATGLGPSGNVLYVILTFIFLRV